MTNRRNYVRISPFAPLAVSLLPPGIDRFRNRNGGPRISSRRYEVTGSGGGQWGSRQSTLTTPNQWEGTQ